MYSDAGMLKDESKSSDDAAMDIRQAAKQRADWRRLMGW